MKKTKEFPPVYCIVYDEERKRRESCGQHLELEQGLKPRYVSGIQGETIGLRATNPYQDDEFGAGQYIHNTVVGHFLSYRSALASALAEGHEKFFVLEDTVRLVDNFQKAWQDSEENLPADTDVVQLQYYYTDDKDGRYEKINDSFARCYRYPFQTGAIYWTRDAARKAVAMLRPVDRPLDVMLLQRIYPFLNHYITVPALAK